MPPVNRTIVASTVIIMAAGAYHLYIGSTKSSPAQGKILVRILIGGFMLAFIVSLFELFGQSVGQVAGWILMLAMGVSIFTVAQDFFPRLNKQQSA